MPVIIAENIPENPKLTGLEGPFDGCWHESFRMFVVEQVSGKTFNWEKLKEVIEAKNQGYSDLTNAINYLASHERNHLMRELGDRGIFDAAAFKRAKLGAVLLLTAMGVPTLYP